MVQTPAQQIPGINTFGDFRDQFLDWLNRPDISTTQANRIVQRAIGRLNRDMRTPVMDRDISNMSVSGPISSFSLPDDFLEFQNVTIDGIPAFPCTFERFQTLPANPGRGAQFARDGGSVVFKPAANQSIRVKYYGAFPQMVGDSDTSTVLTEYPELLMWACLSGAGDMFALDQQAGWEANYQRELASFNAAAQKVDRLGGPTQVSPVQGYAQ